MWSVGRGQLFEMALIDPVWLNFTSLFDYKRNLNILKEMLFSRSFLSRSLISRQQLPPTNNKISNFD